MLAHLSSERITPGFKAGDVTYMHLRLMRDHIEELFLAFANALSQDERDALVNPLRSKFTNFRTFEV
jgi:hypothetical protein